MIKIKINKGNGCRIPGCASNIKKIIPDDDDRENLRITAEKIPENLKNLKQFVKSIHASFFQYGIANILFGRFEILFNSSKSVHVECLRGNSPFSIAKKIGDDFFQSRY